jgi:hypothetical protein
MGYRSTGGFSQIAKDRIVYGSVFNLFVSPRRIGASKERPSVAADRSERIGVLSAMPVVRFGSML